MSPDVKETEIWDKIVNFIERCRGKGVKSQKLFSGLRNESHFQGIILLIIIVHV